MNRKSFREFFKIISFSRIYHYSNFFKSSFSLSSIGQDSKQYFCHFPSKIFKGFCLLRLIRPFYPSFFIYFLSFMCFGENFKPMKIGVFGVFNLFFQNWSLGFCYGMLLNWSLWFNLINLLNWKKLNFLGLKLPELGILFNWALIYEIGLFGWLNWSLYSVISLL